MPRCWIWIAALVLAAAPKGIAGADDDDSRRHAEQLFALAREPSAKNLRAVEHYYRSLPNAVRNQSLLKYAYSIALIHQRNLHEAAKLIHELAEEQPEEFAFCRTKLWLALTLAERTRALTEIEQLAGHARAHHEAENEPLEELEVAEFLGAVCGFFAGPWSASVHDADRQRLEDHLRAVFDEESRTAFDRSKAKVVESYETRRQAHEERTKAELAAKAKDREKEQEAAAQADQTVAAKQQTVKDKEKKRDRDAKAKLDDLDDEVQEIDEKRQALLMEIAPLEAQRVALVSQLVPMPLPFSRIPNIINTRRVLFAEGQKNRAIGLMLAPIVARLTTLETQVASLNQAELEHWYSIGVTEIKHQTDLGKLARQEQSLEKDKKRIQYDARRLKAKPLARSPRLRTEAEQLTRFSTYMPFDFEREKKWLLDKLDN